MEKEKIKLVITGNIDHGKSTLIGRLLLDTNSLSEGKLSEIKKISRELGKDIELAYLVDQLKEERERNLTIDTTQIFFSTKKSNFVVIDTPGHVEFLKNMITGVSEAESAILIIDVSEGIREQTMRHAYIIDMMGIDKIIVVLNKMDVVNYDKKQFDKVNRELLGIMRNFKIDYRVTIPISAKYGDNIAKKSRNMPWYKGLTLLTALESVKPKVKVEKLPLRFIVQDIYQRNGSKIAAGKVISGSIKKGEPVIVLPLAEKTIIDSIEVFNQQRTEAYAGENIGIILRDSFLLKRGEVLVQEEYLPKITTDFVGSVFWMLKEPLLKNQTVTVRCLTQEFNCTIEKIINRVNTVTLEIEGEDVDKLNLNEAGEVVFKPEQAVVLEKFSFIRELGRFVIESDNKLAGAGIVKGSCRL